jgi:mono/diheme cytochrome c family protein
MNGKRWIVAILLSAAFAINGYVLAMAQDTRTTGLYSEEQAVRGKAEFAKSCAACHTIDKSLGDTFAKNPPASAGVIKLPLAGGNVIAKWRTVGDLFSKVRRTMPANNQNGLTDASYLDVMAYMLQANGLAPGKPLIADANALHKLTIDSSLVVKSGANDVSQGRYYTEKQAARGKAYFHGNCMTCHTTNPDGEPTALEAATGHRGSMFGGGWRVWAIRAGQNGAINRWQRVFDLYNKISQTMPAHDPGGLSQETYVDIAAYLLQVYGFPAGEEELRFNVNAMRSMTLNEPGFTKIFNGRDFSGIKFYLGAQCAGTGKCAQTQPAGAFKVEEGTIISSGTPEGYWYYDKQYLDFTLRLEFRYFPIPGLENENEFLSNSGYLLFITQHAVWPKCIEIQGQNLQVGQAFGVGTDLKVTVDSEARLRARKPVGQWNAMEIVSKGGKVVVSLNGAGISTVTEHEFKQPGYIGFQSEGGRIQWRNIRIKED